MNLEQLAKQLKDHNQHPPIERWNPDFCGDIDIHIQPNGTWHYMGTPIGRQSLVKLFASVLTIQNHEYYLVTPSEKVRIKVDDAPFVIIHWHYDQSEKHIIFTSNTGDEFLLSPQYPLSQPAPTQQAGLYLDIHRNMQASIHRNVYYQLAEIAKSHITNNKEQWFIVSGGENYVIAEDD